MPYKTLTYKVDNNIAFLTLSSPPANSMTALFFEELMSVCEDHIIKADFEGLVINSEGRHFSSGADVDELLEIIQKEPDASTPVQIKKNLKAFHILHSLGKPIVAVLRGVCYGSALELALCARYRIAAPNTLLALPESSFGLMPGLGGISMLCNKIGFAQTLDMVMTCRSIFAEEALSMGLIDFVSEKDLLEKKAVEIIKALFLY